MAAAALVSSKQRLYNTFRLSSAPFLCRRDFSKNSSSSSSSSSSNNREDGNEFESLFGNPSPSKASSEPAFWKSLMKDSSSSSKNSKVDAEKKQGLSSSSTTTDWDFLKEIKLSSSSSSSSRNFASSQDAARPSFRKLGESGSGFDFLSAEDLDRPYTKKDASKEEAKQEETDGDFGELSIMKSASFQLLRESFQKVSQPSNDMKTLDSALGLDSGTLFTSQEPWSKSVGSQTLAEFEGNFYSSSDAQAAEDVKNYTYEELGSKLQQVRPSKDQILFSATGLSFGELRTRLQKVEELENEALEEDDQSKNYRDLRESIGHLRDGVHSPKALTATKHLSYEELTFINTISSKSGPPIKIEYTPPKDHLLTKYYSEVQLSSKERLNLEIKKLREEFQTHEYDSGSPQVQIAILTARINNVNRHLREGPNYKRDKHSRKGLNDMVQYRKKLLRYLRRKDWPVYCNVLTKLNLDDIILSQRG